MWCLDLPGAIRAKEHCLINTTLGLRGAIRAKDQVWCLGLRGAIRVRATPP